VKENRLNIEDYYKISRLLLHNGRYLDVKLKERCLKKFLEKMKADQPAGKQTMTSDNKGYTIKLSNFVERLDNFCDSFEIDSIHSFSGSIKLKGFFSDEYNDLLDKFDLENKDEEKINLLSKLFLEEVRKVLIKTKYDDIINLLESWIPDFSDNYESYYGQESDSTYLGEERYEMSGEAKDEFALLALNLQEIEKVTFLAEERMKIGKRMKHLYVSIANYLESMGEIENSNEIDVNVCYKVPVILKYLDEESTLADPEKCLSLVNTVDQESQSAYFYQLNQFFTNFLQKQSG
jgi:hypothetical protein